MHSSSINVCNRPSEGILTAILTNVVGSISQLFPESFFVASRAHICTKINMEDQEETFECSFSVGN